MVLNPNLSMMQLEKFKIYIIKIPIICSPNEDCDKNYNEPEKFNYLLFEIFNFSIFSPFLISADNWKIS